jgi:hypothetical protein
MCSPRMSVHGEMNCKMVAQATQDCKRPLATVGCGGVDANHCCRTGARQELAAHAVASHVTLVVHIDNSHGQLSSTGARAVRMPPRECKQLMCCTARAYHGACNHMGPAPAPPHRALPSSLRCTRAHRR